MPAGNLTGLNGGSQMLFLRRVRGGVASLLILVAVVVAACSGTAATTAPGGADPTPTPAAATPTPVVPDGGVPTETPVVAGPAWDISKLVAGLDNVDSYRVSISTDGTEAFSGTVVTKPTLARRVTLGDSTFIIIGNDIWISDDGVTFEKDPSGFGAAILQGFDPTLMVAAFSGPQWAQSALAVGKEEKNGVSATHYRIDPSTLVGGFTGVPEGATIDLWIADSGILVAFESTGFAGQESLSIQVTNIDDPANKVEAPN